MFTKAGVKGQGVGFLFTDNQIVQERFLVSNAERSIHCRWSDHERNSVVTSTIFHVVPSLLTLSR